MKKWVIGFFAVTLSICLAMPVLAADQGESVWAKYNMKLYGRVKVDYKYLDGRSTSTSVAYNMVDKMTVPDYNNDSTNFTAKDTRFGFIASHAEGEWAAQGRFEMDMFGNQSGNTSDPRFRLGYVDLANKDWGTSVRAGQDWTPVLQLNPSTIDFGVLSATGNLWWRLPQFTVRQQVAGGLEFLLSAMLPRRQDTASESRMPWLLGRAAYSFDLAGGKHMVAANGGYRYDQTAANTNHIDRWLLGAELKFDFDPVLVKGEFWYGDGIGGDFLRYGLDTYTSGGTTRAWNAWGFWADATYSITPKWSVTAGLGVDNPDDNGYNRANISTANINRTFTQSYNAFGNVWYTLGPDVKVGFEAMFLEAEREKLNGNSFKDKGQRYTMSLYYGF